MSHFPPVLASASPRRRELLRLLNLSFEIAPTNVDETPQPNETAPELVARLSQLKANAARKQFPNATVISADTDVELDHRILGKPRDAMEATAMLNNLRGRVHSVYGGLTLADARGRMTQVTHTRVWMRNYSDAEIKSYVATGDPLDKAAAYAVQHQAFRPVERVEGCFANVMGLALCRLYQMLASSRAMPAPEIECHWHPEENCTVEQMVAEGVVVGH